MRPLVRFRAALVVAALAVGSSAVLADPGAPVAASCPKSPGVRYFPEATFVPFVEEWYSKKLVAMGEPSLSCGVLEDAETYRFLWIPAFLDSVAVRVFRRGDDYGLEAVILGPGHYVPGADRYDLPSLDRYYPGDVSRRVTRALSRDEWQTVIARLDEIQFWQMRPTGCYFVPCDLRGGNSDADGARWIVEARRNGRYHIVDRLYGPDSTLRSVGRLFTNLANLKAGGL